MELIINFVHPIRRRVDDSGGYTAATDGPAGFLGGFWAISQREAQISDERG